MARRDCLGLKSRNELKNFSTFLSANKFHKISSGFSESMMGSKWKFSAATHFSVQERQAFIKIFNFVDSHASVVGLAELLARNDLQQFQKLHAVGQVDEEIFDLHFCLDGIIKANISNK